MRFKPGFSLAESRAGSDDAARQRVVVPSRRGGNGAGEMLHGDMQHGRLIGSSGESPGTEIVLRVCCRLRVVPGLYWALSGHLTETRIIPSKMAFRPYFIRVEDGGRYWTRTSDLVHVRHHLIYIYLIA